MYSTKQLLVVTYIIDYVVDARDPQTKFNPFQFSFSFPHSYIHLHAFLQIRFMLFLISRFISKSSFHFIDTTSMLLRVFCSVAV